MLSKLFFSSERLLSHLPVFKRVNIGTNWQGGDILLSQKHTDNPTAGGIQVNDRENTLDTFHHEHFFNGPASYVQRVM